jgi:hypothetical protein
MKKALILFLAISFLASACGNSDANVDFGTNSGETARTIHYKTAEFAIEAPADWEILNAFDSSYPENIRVAFKDNIKDGDFVANLTVMREENPQLLTSFDVIQDKLFEHKSHLLNFELLVEESLTLSVGGGESKTSLFTFSGKNTSSSETLHFMQLALAKTDRAYLVTATYSPNEDEFVVERLEHMLKSFELR